VQKTDWFSAPSIFSTAFDGFPYRKKGNTVENGRIFWAVCAEQYEIASKNVKFDSLTKNCADFWQLPRGPPLQSGFSKI